MKKLSIPCLLLFFFFCFSSSALAAEDMGGQQYVEPYNALVNAINERIESVDGIPGGMPKKNKGDSVTQADLNLLRGAVSDLISRGHFVDSSDPATAKSLTINDGKGFLTVPGQYTSNGSPIYNSNFSGVPIFWIHFTDIQKALELMKTTKTSLEGTLTVTGYTGGSGPYPYSTVSFGDAIANINWSPKETGWVPWGNIPLQGSGKGLWCDFWECYWQGDGGEWYGDAGISGPFGYEVYGWYCDSFTLDFTIPESAHRSSAKFYIRRKLVDNNGVEEKTAEGLWIWKDISEPLKEEWKEVETGESESVNFSWCSDPPSPVYSPNPGNGMSFSYGNYGSYHWTEETLCGEALMSEYDFSEISLPGPSGAPEDKPEDGVVASGCDCTTCMPQINFEHFAEEAKIKAKVPLGYSGQETCGLRVLAYVSDYTVAGLQKQMFNLDTRIISNSSGHDPKDSTNTYHFVEVLRPSGARVAYSMEGSSAGKAVSGEGSQTMKIVDGAYELSFANDVTHRFWGGSLVQCRQKSSGNEELVVDKEGGNWPEFSVEYSGKKLTKLTGPSFYTIPIYSGDFIQYGEFHSLSGSLIGHSGRSNSVAPDGTTTTGVTNYDGLGRAFSKFEIIYNPNNETYTEKIYDAVSGNLAKTVVRSEEIIGPLDKILKEVVNPGAENLVSTKNIHTFPWDTEITEEKIAVGTAFEKTTKYTFYDDAENDGPNYSNLKLQENPDGSWIRYVYDSKDRVVKAISPFGNAAPDAADLSPIAASATGEDQCQVVESDYSAIPESPDTADADETRAHKVTQFVKGVPVSRSLNLYYGNKTVSILCASPGAAWDNPANIVTSSECYTAADDDPSINRRGRLKKTTNADGTISVYTYSISGGNLYTTCDTGAGSGYTVTDGTRTLTVSNKSGNTISENSSDISSSITLADTSYIRDDFGRTTRANYMDGSFTATEYGCCGPEKETSREGTVTVNAYTGLKQLSYTTTAGVCNLYVYDVSGNVISETRKGSDGSEFTTTNAYNPAGEQISSADPMGNATTYSQDCASRILTTINPDGSTIIQQYNIDKTPLGVSGSAVHGVKYEYGIDGTSSDLWTKVIPTGNESQWTKSFTDFLGRTYKTVTDKGVMLTTFYDTSGRPVKRVDADGVSELIEYNAKGEVARSAVDANASGAIDEGDRITSYVNEMTAAHGTNVRKSTTSRNGVVESVSEVSVDGLKSWNTSFGRTSSSETTYNGNGQKTVVVTNPDSASTVLLYQDGKLISSTHSVLGATTYAYDSVGRMASETKTENGEQRTSSYSYDKNDRLVSLVESSTGVPPVSRVTEFTYNSMGRVVKETLPDGRSKNYEYYLTGELKSETGAETYPVAYEFDSMGQKIAMTLYRNYPDLADTTRWEYDYGRKTAKIYPDGSRVAFSYTTAV